jgi:hypothetical protein
MHDETILDRVTVDAEIIVGAHEAMEVRDCERCTLACVAETLARQDEDLGPSFERHDLADLCMPSVMLGRQPNTNATKIPAILAGNNRGRPALAIQTLKSFIAT